MTTGQPTREQPLATKIELAQMALAVARISRRASRLRSAKPPVEHPGAGGLRPIRLRIVRDRD